MLTFELTNRSWPKVGWLELMKGTRMFPPACGVEVVVAHEHAVEAAGRGACLHVRLVDVGPRQDDRKGGSRGYDAGKKIKGRKRHIVVDTLKRTDDMVGFEVLPHRWIVERTFAWLGRFRRLSKDYEVLIETSKAMIHVAMIRLMLWRLAS